MVFLQIKKIYLGWYALKYKLRSTEGLLVDDSEGHLRKKKDGHSPKTKADVQCEDGHHMKMLRNVVRAKLDIKVLPRECEPLKEKPQVTLNCKYWFAVSHEGNSLQCSWVRGSRNLMISPPCWPAKLELLQARW